MSYVGDRATGRAKEKLVHYFKLACTGDGPIRWDFDNETEVAAITDEIIVAAVEQVKESFPELVAELVRDALVNMPISDLIEQPDGFAVTVARVGDGPGGCDSRR